MAQWQAGGSFLGRVAGFATRRAVWVLTAWVLAAGVLNVAVPQLEKVVANDATPFIPADAGSVQAFEQMDRAFGTGEAKALTFVVLTGAHGIPDTYYRALVHRLEAGRAHVVDVEDYAAQPELRGALVSEDHRATYLPVAIRHPVGSPEADKDIGWIRQATAQGRPAGVRAYVTGDPATVTDLNAGLQRSIRRVTVVTVVIILLILLLLYRNLVTPLIALGSIGVSLACARGLVALLGQSVLPVSTYTGTFVTALVLGAGTDYTVFLVSRFHEALRDGQEPGAAVVTATRRIGTVIAASGATVIIGSACMRAAHLALFRTTGPAIAVSVFVTLLVSLSLTPALLALAGRRAGPRRAARGTEARWARVGTVVATHPLRLVVACLVLLGVLAAFYPMLHPTYDTRALEPASSESDRGYRALDRHFPGYELRPDYLLIRSDHDLRNSRDLATLDLVADSVDKLPVVESVRAATRPQGSPIPQAQLPYDIARVGSQLDQAGQQVRRGGGQADQLAAGAQKLSVGAGRLSDGAGRASAAVDRFLAGLHQEGQGLGTASGGAARAADGAAQLRDGARELAAGLRDAHDQTVTAVRYLGLIRDSLQADALCTVDPICHQARDGIAQIYAGEHDELLPGLVQAADAADRIAAGDGALTSALDRLQEGIAKANDGIAKLEAGEREFQTKLGRLAGGAAQLRAGVAQVPAGVAELQQATGKLAAGLDQAARFLSSTATNARAAGIDAFYLPPGALDDPRFTAARDYFISPDGHTARMLVFGDEQPSRAGAEKQAIQHTLRGTRLAGARITATGPIAIENDIHRLADADFHLVAAVTLIAVLLILVALLRAIVAPLYLLGSVLLSYAAAMGLTALLFQDLLGKPMDWTVPLLAFVILVAVGADYNILLMSRVREESAAATRSGVARAVASTGGVITSAGLIFAGTFIAMTASPVIGLAETGFAVAAGLMLDTFVVRSLLVPSTAALLGRWNWWPSGRRTGAQA